MTARSVVDIVRALNATGERYLIAGGLAVVAHGYLRFTADVDLMLDFASPGLDKTIVTLSEMGYKPRVPVRLEAIVDAAQRESWIRDKGAVVLNLTSADHPRTNIDLFLQQPLSFDEYWSRMVQIDVTTDVTANFVSRGDLLDMKRRAGRAVDLQDILMLEKLDRTEPS